MAISWRIRFILTGVCLSLGASGFAQERDKKIEEVVVYGQKNEATVSDTSIAITAMTAGFLEDMGIQGPNELVNFIPATTRTDWDIKIRGVGRNFRGLGGDPGVGTYYNGIYSPDFGIASTEGGLYDVKRIEVLRGPQGTLYGRNSIGGVMNYVTNQPDHDGYEGQIRSILGQYNTNEWYGFVTGPITDSLAGRLVLSQRNSDGRVEGLGNAKDVEEIDDRNIVLTLDWQVNDKFSVNLRVNDRISDRAGNFGNGGHGILSEGPCISMDGSAVTNLNQCDPQYRVARDTNHYVTGLRPVDADFAGAFPFVNPVTGDTVYATYKRPGVDPAIWPFAPSPNYQDPFVAQYDGGDNAKPDFKSLTNNFVRELFEHSSASVVAKWDINDKLSAHYLGNYQAFDYFFDRDNDFSSSALSSMGDTVLEHVHSFSHELRVFWELGDRWTATSGLFYFLEDRRQHYGIRNRLGQGFVNNATIYGPEGNENWVTDGLAVVGWIMPECFDWRAANLNADGGYGKYCGDSGTANDIEHDTGAVYEHDNFVETENAAFYTQGDLQLSDTFSVTLGLRYSEDVRDVLEQRGGYSELPGGGGGYAWLPWALSEAAPEGFDKTQFFNPGVTPLAAMNVALGAATFTGDPTGEMPIEPVCPLGSLTCDRPLRLGGIPISWGSRIASDFATDRWSYRVNFNWEPNPDTLWYFGATSSYRAGGFNMGGADNRATVSGINVLKNYKDEELVSYELGYKGVHFDGKMTLTAALYRYNYENYQDHVERWETENGDFALPDGIDAPAGRGPVEGTTNIPKAHNQGFEFDVLYLLSDAFTVGGNYSYTISEWDTAFTLFNQNDPRYPRDVFSGIEDAGADPCTLEPSIADLYCLQADGIQLSGIPKHKATLWAAYQMSFSAGTLTWYSSMAFTGEYFTSAFARPWDEVPDRMRTDTRLTFLSSDETWSAAFFVDNLFDETYLRWADMEPRRTGYGMNYPHRAVALEPRFIALEMVYNFKD